MAPTSAEAALPPAPAMVARDAHEALDASEARDAHEALAAHEALDALAALAARDASEARVARVAQRADALCLQQMLNMGRQSYLLLPHALALVYFAVQAGAPIWAAIWFTAWIAREALAHRLKRRLQRASVAPAATALDAVARGYFVAGLVSAGLLPVFFTRSTDQVLGIVMVLVTVHGAAALVAACGALRAWIGFSVPLHGAVIVGFVWRGGVAGWVSAGFVVLSFVLGVVVVRSQRQSTLALAGLIDDNETLSKALAHERDRAEAERDRAEAASQSKTRFFAAASHDLRQPLHALSINATTLDLVAQRSGDALLKELSQGINSALRQSRSLLDGLLDISRLDAHAVQTCLTPQDMGMVLETVREEYAALAARQGLTLEVSAGGGGGGGGRDAAAAPWALTDADQLLRILANLVDNAIKFTRQGGVVLSARRVESGRVLVRVSDTGPGIAAAERERVFEEFYQVGNPSRDRAQGLGLGLAIVKRTAALLEIPLQLISEPGRGATFELSLPAATSGVSPPQTQTPSALSAMAAPGAGKTLSVLLVDDEPDGLIAMCTYLRQIGWSALGVASGDEADLALAQGFFADVLVVDFRLRAETGVDVITRLRKQHGQQHGKHHGELPAVIVTGDTAAQRLREFAALRATVLHKPIDGEKLARALVDAVGR